VWNPSRRAFSLASGNSLGLDLNVRDVNGPRVQHRAAADRSTVKRKGVPAYGPQRAGNGRSVVDRTVMSRHDEPIVTAEKKARVVRFAQPGRALHHRVKHGLDVGRGAGDHAKDLARGGLLLQRLGQVAVSALELLEQPHVLDRDHRLRGKGLEELDLLVVERSGLHPGNGNGADRLTVPEHRYGERGPKPSLHGGGRGILGILGDIGDLDHCPGENRARGRRAATGRDREDAPHGILPLRRPVVMRYQVDQAVGVAEHARVGRLAQHRRALRDGFEDRLDVFRRAGDHSEDRSRGRLLLERLGQLPVPGLELLEQPHVLDRDHRLRGEGLR
jgi:hypothetical protein